MPRRRDPLSPQMVHRTARAGLRATRGQRRRLIGLLISAGDVWTAVLELNGRVAGVDPGIIHPYAVAGPGGEGLLVSGRAVRAEHRMHLADTKARRKAVARRARLRRARR